MGSGQESSRQLPQGAGRADQHRCGPAAERGRQVRFRFDGRAIAGCEGESIAAALAASGHRILRYTGRRGEPRGVFCNMGICFDCLVEIDGRPNQRACRSPVVEGIEVTTQQGVGRKDGA